MNRQQLVALVADRLGDPQLADAAVTALVETIAATVAAGEPVVLRGFGRWRRRRRPPTRTVPATYVARFDAGKAFRDAVARPRA
ncbi:MAG: HU family DNA-binding protein [Actinoallomurus sp.]